MFRTLTKLCLVGAPLFTMACVGEIGDGIGQSPEKPGDPDKPNPTADRPDKDKPGPKDTAPGDPPSTISGGASASRTSPARACSAA